MESTVLIVRRGAPGVSGKGRDLRQVAINDLDYLGDFWGSEHLWIEQNSAEPAR